MIRNWMISGVTLALLGGVPTMAQGAKQETRREPAPVEAEAQAGEPTASATGRTPSDAERVRERVRRAIRLPQVVRESTEAGVPEEKVREVLATARGRGIPASDVEEILEAENEALRQGGNPDNFGAAVQQMKASGLRGRELAQAIHDEQIARGMKKPKAHKDDKHKLEKIKNFDDDDEGHDRDVEHDRDDEDGHDERKSKGEHGVDDKAKAKEKSKGKGKKKEKH